MTRQKMICVASAACLLAACGGGGGSGGGAGGPGGPVDPMLLTLADTSAATSTLSGALLTDAGDDTQLVSGTVDHAAQEIAAGATVPATSLGDVTAFSFSRGSYAFIRDIQVDSQTSGIFGVSAVETGTANYTGEFEARLLANGAAAPVQLNNWTADIDVDFGGGSGTVDATFAGAGSTAVNEIRIVDASVSGNTFSGGTITTENAGGARFVPDSHTFVGATFGYDPVLDTADEVGGALTAETAGGDILFGLFMAD
ncbi:hypothetical protein [Yoonia sp. SS1-5]|uniref:Uncharacterized protein n=1 Tax=Yoonia rhodophyticola TaxID=3137370 RepID=A0AAN0MMH9_9RHOB